MGSDSDLPTMAAARDALLEFGIEAEVTVVSAHRTPDRMVSYAREAASRGIKVIIAGAGGAAHLPGMVAAMTPLPVVGVPVVPTSGGRLDGHGRAALHRADAEGRSRRHGRHRERRQRRAPRRADPGVRGRDAEGEDGGVAAGAEGRGPGERRRGSRRAAWTRTSDGNENLFSFAFSLIS